MQCYNCTTSIVPDFWVVDNFIFGRVVVNLCRKMIEKTLSLTLTEIKDRRERRYRRRPELALQTVSAALPIPPPNTEGASMRMKA